jgi:hypothetical protein
MACHREGRRAKQCQGEATHRDALTLMPLAEWTHPTPETSGLGHPLCDKSQRVLKIYLIKFETIPRRGNISLGK